MLDQDSSSFLVNYATLLSQIECSPFQYNIQLLFVAKHLNLPAVL